MMNTPSSSMSLDRSSNQQQKILILTAIPHGLRLDKEIRGIEEAIRRSAKRDLFKICIRTAVRSHDVRREIAEEQPQIVHFCGHGLDDGSLMLEDDGGNNKPVSPEGLASLFESRENYVNCVLLNACHSEKTAIAISQYVNYVIGMNQSIEDKAAIVFAQGFYDGLGYENVSDRDCIERAFEEGIRAVKMENIEQGSIPTLKKKLLDTVMQSSCNNTIYPITLVQKYHENFIVKSRVGKFLPALLVILPTIGFTVPQFCEYLNVNIFAGELFIPFMNLVPYENLVHNFVIKHPSNWLHQKEDNPITHEVVSFMPPSKIETMQNPQVEVIVSKEDLYEPITLSNYMEQLINQHKNTRNFQSFKIINQGATTFAQRPAQSLTYTVTSEGKSWKILEVATIQNLQVYLITYKAEISQYDKYQAIAHKMVHSFEISKN